jgi:hypothetical protein
VGAKFGTDPDLEKNPMSGSEFRIWTRNTGYEAITGEVKALSQDINFQYRSSIQYYADGIGKYCWEHPRMINDDFTTVLTRRGLPVYQ